MLGNVVITKGPKDVASLRREWGNNLAEHLACRGLSRKWLQSELARHGVVVSHQAISAWMKGKAAPDAMKQAVIAQVLNVPHRSLFPVPTVAAS